MSDYWVRKFGRAADVDAADTDIYDVSTGTYEFPTVATSTQVVGIANDLPNSDGVHSVIVEGLLADGSEVSEVATLNGATPVVLTNSYFRVNRMYIQAVGASGVNSGEIRCTHSGSATLALISPLKGQTLQAVFTMPAGVNGAIYQWNVDAARESSQVNVQGGFELQVRHNGEGWRTQDAGLAGNTQSVHRDYWNMPSPIAVKPLTDVRIRCTAINTNNVAVTANFVVKGFRNIR